MNKPVIRCAIYTRKSTDEGLEKEFNTLDAQREACLAYITAQKSEGWQALETNYSDGGFSGGNAERPALRQLLNDIKARLVNTVVVYKVDRLSRSLHDFVKMIALFENYQVSFVSVTQQFNTTSSMGRLTLNVLLSFAQFEREVISERIRDKLTASRQRGMYMGGVPPLGYQIKDSKLLVVPTEAELVKKVFELYLETGSVVQVIRTLTEEGYTSRKHTTKTGRKIGGLQLSSFLIRRMLRNPIYYGKIRAAGKIYPGRQTAIIPQQLWNQVQTIVHLTPQQRRDNYRIETPALLAGLVFCGGCRKPLTASCSTAKNGERRVCYRHSVAKQTSPNQNCRTSAVNDARLKALVLKQLQSVLADRKIVSSNTLNADKLKSLLKCGSENCQDEAAQRQLVKLLIKQILVYQEHVKLEIKLSNFQPQATQVYKKDKNDVEQCPKEIIAIDIPFLLFKRCARRLKGGPKGQFKSLPAIDKALVNILCKAHRWQQQMDSGKFRSITDLAQHHQVGATYASKILRINLLSPKIKLAILNGTQPRSMTLQKLMNSFPLLWINQEKFFELRK